MDTNARATEDKQISNCNEIQGFEENCSHEQQSKAEQTSSSTILW
jgi:hypothetical protein